MIFKTIGCMYYTTLAVILSGVLNMVFCKTKFYKKYKKPIDCGKCFCDGKRLLGDNKTYIGFCSMVVICTLLQIALGIITSEFALEGISELYRFHENTIWYNAMIGFCYGLAYMVCELPNSFIKRRIGVPDGKTISGVKGALFFVGDQLDSMFGVMLVLVFASAISPLRYLAYVLIGGGTHIAVNLILYALKIRKNL